MNVPGKGLCTLLTVSNLKYRH